MAAGKKELHAQSLMQHTMQGSRAEATRARQIYERFLERSSRDGRDGDRRG